MNRLAMTHSEIYEKLITMPDYTWRVRKHTYLMFVPPANGQIAKDANGVPLRNQDIGLRYFETFNVKYKPNGDIVLFGGWRRPTTVNRINFGLPPSMELLHSDVWEIRTIKGTYRFQEGTVISPDGTIEQPLEFEIAPIRVACSNTLSKAIDSSHRQW